MPVPKLFAKARPPGPTTTKARPPGPTTPRRGTRADDGRVFVALSGGVDSAVALALLARSGAPVEALFMKNWEEDDAPGYCAAAEDLADAESVCRSLGVALHTVNFATEYWDRVFERFVAEYRAARTPNPDVLCNQEVKFDVFAQHARDLGADELATGHYARVDRVSDSVQGKPRYRLLSALDENKDQSFFLHRLSQAQLSRVRFPLGELTKPEVRNLAREMGLVTHDKKDSTGICFIGERPFREFLARYVEQNPGPIETVEGKVIGEHVGLSYYTIGQRQGLGIGGQRREDGFGSGRAASVKPGQPGQAWYVAAKVRSRNALVVAQGHDHPALYASALYAGETHWIAGPAPRLPLRASARIRHRQPLQACIIDGDTDTGERGPSPGRAASTFADKQGRDGSDVVRVRFEQPQWAVAPGQSIAFYSGEECLGGAVIDLAFDAPYPEPLHPEPQHPGPPHHERAPAPGGDAAAITATHKL